MAQNILKGAASYLKKKVTSLFNEEDQPQSLTSTTAKVSQPTPLANRAAARMARINSADLGYKTGNFANTINRTLVSPIRTTLGNISEGNLPQGKGALATFSRTALSPVVNTAKNIGQNLALTIQKPQAQASLTEGLKLQQDLTNRIKLAQKQGDFQTAKRLQAVSASLGTSNSNLTRETITSLQQNKERIIPEAIRAALTLAAPSAGVPAVAGGAALGGGLQTAIDYISGNRENLPASFAQGAGESVKFAGLNKATGPIFDQLIKRTNLINEFAPRVLARAGMGGATNLLEDELYNRLVEKRGSTPEEAIFSVAMGAFSSAFGEATKEDQEAIKKTLEPITNKAGRLIDPASKQFLKATESVKNTFSGITQRFNDIEKLQKAREGFIARGNTVEAEKITNTINNIRKEIDGEKPYLNAAGLMFGMEVEQDEDGNYRIKYNPTKGLIGMAGSIAANKGLKGGLDVPLPPSQTEKTGAEVLQSLDDDFKKARELRAQSKKPNTGLGTLRSLFLDRFYAAEKVDRDLFINLRNLAGGGNARAEQFIEDGLAPVFIKEKEAGRLQDFSKYLGLQRLQELVGKRGLERQFSQNEINAGLLELNAKYSPEQMADMEQSAQQLRGFLSNLLDQSVRAGLISEDAANAARKNNEYYVTFETLGQIARKAEEGGFGRGSNSFNVSKQDVLKTIGSSNTGIADPLEAVLEYANNTIRQIDRNSVLKEFVERRGNLAGNIQDNVAIPLRQAENVRERININSEISELIPLRKQVQKLIKTRDKWVRQLQSQVNKLNLEGLNIALKKESKDLPSMATKVGIKETSGKPKFGEGELQDVVVGGTPGTAQAFDVKQSTLNKRGERSTKRFIESLIELPSSDIKRIQGKIGTKEKEINGLLENLVKLSDEYQSTKDRIVDLRIKRGEIRDVKNAPEGFGTINVFRDGIKEEWAVPKDLEKAVKNLNAQASHWIMKFFTAPVKVLKNATITYNPAFWAINPERDLQDVIAVKTTEKGLKKTAAFLGNYIRSMADSAGMSEEYKAWRRSGAGSSTFASQELGGNPEKTLSELADKNSNRFSKAFKKPHQLAEWLSRVTEEGTRLAEFKTETSKEAIESLKEFIPYGELSKEVREGAFSSRNITLDFARMGEISKVINQIVPFFNVGVQGTAKLASLIKDNPAGAIKSATLFAAIPALAAYANNRQFEDYQDLSDYEKKDNFVFIIKDRTPEEREAGAKLHAIKIPLANIMAPFFNVATNFLEFANKENPQSVSEFAANLGMLGLQTAEDLSPVGLPYNADSTRRFINNSLPLTAKIPTQLLANRDFYTGIPIESDYINGVPRESVPDQYRTGYNTGPTTEALGRLTGNIGISPAELDNLIGATLGGGGKALLQATDFMAGKPSKGPTGNPLIDPIATRFYGAQGGQIARNERQQETQESKKIAQEDFAGTPLNLGGIFGRVATGAEQSSGAPMKATALPDSQSELKVLYDDANSIIKNYEKKKTRIQYDTDIKSETKRKRELKELDAEYEAAKARISDIETAHPDKVYKIQLESYGKGSNFSVEDRADWAYNKLNTFEKEEDLQKSINEMWEAGVLTKGSNGVAQYIKEVYGVDVFKYTGNNAKIKKAVASGQGKTKIKKMNIEIPKIKATPSSKVKSFSSSKELSSLAKLLTKQSGGSIKIPQELLVDLTPKPSRAKISFQGLAPVRNLKGLGRS